MKILVTGGAGFIGSHIVDAYLNSGHDVSIIDNFSTGRRENLNPAAKLFEMDINDPGIHTLFREKKFDIVSHQAAQMDVRVSVRDPKFDASTNVMGSLNIYVAAQETGVRKMIFASSGGTIYGEQDYHPADEDHPLRPCSPYGITKLVNEKYLYYYKEVYGIDYVALRYGNVFGPRQNPHGEAGVVAIFIEKMLNGQKPVINGDGLNTRDYVYISDVVSANLIALRDECSGIFNIGNNVETDVNYIFNKLNELTGAGATESHGEAKSGEQRRSVISYNRIKEKHGWKPLISFDDGLKLTVDSIKNHKV